MKKSWPQPTICWHCQPGEDFVSHDDAGDKSCMEIVEERYINGVRVGAGCACKQIRKRMKDTHR